MTNRLRYPFLFTASYLAVWAVLMVAHSENPRVDLFVYGQIALCAAIAAIIMSVGTQRWTLRGLGLWGLMVAIVLLYLPGLLRELGLMDSATPNWLVQMRRAILLVSGPAMLYGFWCWWREDDEAEM